MNNDYIELGPDDVIREGDQFRPKGIPFTMPEPGTKVSDYPNVKFLRLRSEFIKDAAIELLRAIDYRLDGAKHILQDVTESLREAIGISIEELRGGE